MDKTRGPTRTWHVIEPKNDTCQNQVATRGRTENRHAHIMCPDWNATCGQIGRCHVSQPGDDTWPNDKVTRGQTCGLTRYMLVDKYGYIMCCKLDAACGGTECRHVDKYAADTCQNLEATHGNSEKGHMDATCHNLDWTRGITKMLHVEKLEDATCQGLEATRGQTGGSWRVDMWPSTSSLHVHPPTKCDAGTSPNSIDTEPCYLPVWTGTRGFGRPVTFLQCVAKTKMLRWWKFLHHRKKQFRGVYGPFIMVDQTWRGFYNKLKFFTNLSLSFLCEAFGLCNGQTCSSPMLRFPLVMWPFNKTSCVSWWLILSNSMIKFKFIWIGG